MCETILLGIAFVIFGTTIFLKPDWWWLLTEKWKSYNSAEPSDFYKFSTKFGGIIFIILGVFLVILPFILKYL